LDSAEACALRPEMAVVIAPNRDMVSVAFPIRSGEAARLPWFNQQRHRNCRATGNSRCFPAVNGVRMGSLRAG
jgi:hypothetical protein